MDSATSDLAFIDAWAEKRGIPALTRQKWRERKRVPHRYRLEIATAAATEGRNFDPASFDKFINPERDRPPTERAADQDAA